MGVQCGGTRSVSFGTPLEVVRVAKKWITDDVYDKESEVVEKRGRRLSRKL